MRSAKVLKAAVIIALCGTRSLSAQTSNAYRVEFYGSVGVGYGINTINYVSPSAGVTSRTASGPTWYAAFGLSLSPRVALGIEWSGVITGCDPVCSSNTSNYYTAAFTYHLSVPNGFYARINLGYGGEAIHGDASASEGGIAGGVGLGYDWHIGNGGYVVKPFISYLAQFSSVAYSGALTGTTGRATLWQFGVGIGYAR